MSQTTLRRSSGLLFLIVMVLIIASSVQAAEQGGYGLRMERTNALVFIVLFSAVVLWYIRQAIKGVTFYMRPLPGLDAVDEAVGRATEMGRPIVFVPGTDDLDNIQTIAGLLVLGRVARAAARHRTPLRVPVLYPLALAGARETVQQARLDEGISDPLDAETVQYVAGESFSFSARIGGMMVREKPAAGVYMGRFAAESLLIAEMGQLAGAIQIAGTAEPEQLPFFIAACDYTLMGEEFYAASAYLANEPRMLGAIRGQDLLKIVIVAIVVAGVLSISFSCGMEFWQNLLRAQ